MRKSRILILSLILLLSLTTLVSLALAQGNAPETIPAGSPVQEQAPDSILSTAYTYTNTTPVAIPDNNCTTGYVTSTITIPDSFLIADLNVGLWADHTWRSDMDLRLVHPDGTILDLLLDPDSGGDNLNALLDDGSPNLASADTSNHVAPPPYYTAWYKPTSPLSVFNGKNAQGTWTIRACDDTGSDIGNLNTWTLFFETGLVLSSNTSNGAACEGNDVDYTFTVNNATTFTQSFTLNYTSTWPYSGPAATSVLAPGSSESFVVTVHVPNTAAAYDTDTLTATASGGGDSDQTSVTTAASLVEGYTDYADALVNRRVRDHSVVYYNGKLYKIGGYDGSARVYVDIYDIATDTWTTGTDLPGARYWIDCVEIGGKIYCAGGYLTSAQTTLYIYDIATNAWSTGAALPTARYGYAGVAVGGKYYVIGGYSGSAYVNTLWAYDPTTDSWDTTTLASMTAARRDGSAGVIGGKIYITGGRSAASTYVNTTEVYDPALNTWSTVAPLPTTGWVRAADAVKHDRYLLLLGGYSADATASSYALVYDAVSDAWQFLPAMDHLLYGAEADTDATGNVWVASGRLYENLAFSYSRYTFKVDQCTDANADLTCVKSDSADPVNYNETFTYTIAITNTGNADGWNTVVTDTLPAGVTFVSASAGCTESLGIVTCDMGSLRNGESDQVNISVTAPAATVLLDNVAAIASEEYDANLADNTDNETTQVTNASITMAKTVGTDPAVCANTDTIDVLSGTAVTYCYTVLNTGSVTFTSHSLVDSELGTLLTNLPYSLAPGATAFMTATTALTQTTVNDATWTATDGVLTADFTDDATVNVIPASITLDKTVGTDPATCASSDSLIVQPDTDVFYCYTVTNTSPGTLNLHDLADSELGSVLNGFAYALAPGASVYVTATATITQTTVNTATWTAYNAGPIHVATATDTATVTVIVPSNGLPLEDFNTGTAGFPPAGWTIVNNGGTCVWESSETTGYANLTGGTGFAAEANSDWCGSGTTMNTHFYSPFFNLNGATSPVLTYRYDYNDLSTDQGTVDISSDGGATWINLVTYLVDDRGPAQEVIDLSAYIGQPFLQIRFGYVAPGWDWWFQIDDVEVPLVANPDISVDPTAVAGNQYPNEVITHTFDINNTGIGTLTWDIFEDNTAMGEGATFPTPAAGANNSRGGLTGGPAPLIFNSPADFSEGFDDIANLPNWANQNNSAPAGTSSWFQGNDTVFPAHAGATTAYIAANFNNTSGIGVISNWLMTPEVALNNGDTFSFWTRTVTASTWPDRLQLRLSTAGASVNVGTGPDDVGDFTTLLLDINPTLTVGGYPEVWTQYVVTLSGISGGATGRFAFHYYVQDGGPSGNNSNYIGIDTVEYTAGTAAACDAPSDIAWVTVAPTAGTTAIGGSSTINVGFDSTGLTPGVYTANLCVNSDDPDTPMVTVPVAMTVDEALPAIDVNPLTFDVTQDAGTQTTETLTISNIGGASLDWTLEEAVPPLPLYVPNYPADAAVNVVTIGDLGLSGSRNTAVHQPTANPAPTNPDDTTITHSATQTIVTGNSVSCNAAGLHTDNSYIRRFTLSDFGINDDFTVSSVQVGIEEATGAGGTQPTEVVLYTWDPATAFTFANFTQIASVNFDVTDQTLSIITVPVSAVVPAGGTLVVEFFTPDGQTAGNGLFVGSNADGQTDASFLAAADCGITDPMDTALIGFPNMHIVMNVTGNVPQSACSTPSDIPWLVASPTSGSTPTGGSSDVNVTLDATALAAGVYTGTLCVNSNDPATPVVEVPVMLTVTEPPAAIDVNPLALDVTQAVGTQVTDTLTISNIGGGSLDWAINEVPPVNTDGHSLPVPGAKLDPATVSEEVGTADATGSAAPLVSNAPIYTAPDAILYDNGPLVNCPGCGAGGADESQLQSVTLLMTTLGLGHQFLNGNRMADDFTVTGGGWILDTATFYAYQTGSSTNSTMTGVYLQIWDGPPNDPASTVVFGDLTTNRMLSSAWSGIYRTSETSVGATNRPIMASVANLGGLYLPAGTYWFDWMTDGTLASGPWAPPITIAGQTTTGNGMQYIPASGWGPANDGGTLTQQGLPFTISGSVTCTTGGDIPWLTAVPTSGSTPAGSSSIVDLTFDATALSTGVYTGTLCIQSNDAVNPVVEVPVMLTVTDGYGVDMSGDQAQTGDVGTTVTYTVMLTNTGTTTDTFDLAVTGNTWTTTPSHTSVTLGAGQSTMVYVTVDVPAGAANGDMDAATVTATSQTDSSATANATLTTTANIPAPSMWYLYLPMVAKP